MRHVFGYCLLMFTSATMVAALFTPANAAKPSLKGTDLLCNGESFFAASNICSELTRLAQADGVLPASESFKQVAVSGVPIATVFTQFKNANPKPKYVVTDGGGIDLMSNNCTTGDENCGTVQTLKKTMQEYIAEMAKSGVKSFVWMCYPDPQGTNWATLKKGQDIWAVVAKKVMDATTSPKPLWVDLRTTWAGHYSQFTSDGIHATNAGGTATAQAFWDAMKANDWAFFDTGVVTSAKRTTSGNVASMQPAMQIHALANGNASVSLSVDKTSTVTLRLLTVSGRAIFTAQKQTAGSGIQAVEFPLTGISGGIYCCEVRAGKITSQSTVLVQ